MKNKKRIAVSNISLIPRYIDSNSMFDLISQLGIGLQLVPTWGAKEIADKLDPSQVTSLEPIWSYETIFKRLKKIEIKGGLMNLGFFGSIKRAIEVETHLRAKFPNSIHIDFSDSDIIEVCPRGNDIDHFFGKKVVLDSCHIKEFKDSSNPITLLEKVADKSEVMALHLQTRDKGEFDEFINFGTGYLSKFLKAFKHLNVPIVMEMAPHHIMFNTEEKLGIIKARIEELTA